MFNINFAAAYATPQPISTADPTRKLASLIARGTLAPPREARNTWGSSFRGLIGGFFDISGCFVLDPTIRLCRNGRGLVTGFTVGGVSIDYGAMAATTEIARREGLSLLLAGPNANIARKAPASAEERLAKAIAEVKLPEPLAEALATIGMEVERIPLRAATRIATGVVNEALANAVPGARTGHLNLARAFPPSLRRAIAAPLIAGPKADASRDLLQQLPIAAVVPGELASNIGVSPKALLDRLRLPREARRVLPRAVGPIARWLRIEDRELLGEDLRWLERDLCSSLPDRSLEQFRLLDLALTLRLGGASDTEAAARATWAARNPAVVGVEGLRDWLLAPPALIAGLALQAWHNKISAEDATEAVEMFADATAMMADPERGVPFELPRWGVKRKLPGSAWMLVPLRDELELAIEGRLMTNCLGSYAKRCRAGTVIASLRREPRKHDSSRFPRTPDGLLIGGDVEIVHYAGAWQCVQIRGPRNSDAPGSALTALRRLLDEINAPKVG